MGQEDGEEQVNSNLSVWETRRLKFVVTCNDETLPETTDPEFEMEYVDISSVNLVDGVAATEALTFDKAPSRARRIVQDGDTIVSTVRTYLKAIAPIQSPPPNMVVSTGFAVIRPRDAIDAGFLGYALQNTAFIESVVANSTGVSYPAINPSQLISLPIAYPKAHATQKQIAAFLDWKTSQIDALISKKQALLQKLKEKRLAVITQAVIKGLNPDASLRDSGVAWLGEVPAHWDVLKIKFVTELASGHTPSRTVEEYWNDCTIPWVSLNDSKMLREKDSISETHYQISELGLANSSARLLPAGVVVFSRDATVGLCAITEVPMAVSQHFVAYICGEKITGKYLLFVLKAMNQHLQSLQTGSTIVTIGMPEVRGLICPLPTLTEQAGIVAHIDSVTARIDQMLASAETVIARLTEYRSALITAATTGKIDVRGWQPLESSL